MNDNTTSIITMGTDSNDTYEFYSHPNYFKFTVDGSNISGSVPNHYNKEETYTKLETNARIGYKMRNYVRKDVYHKHVGLLETTILQLTSKVQELERMTTELYYPMGK